MVASLPAEKQHVLGQNDVLARLIAAQAGLSNNITPESCMASPTVNAIVTAITRRFAVTPVHVYQKGARGGRETKEKLPDHPVARLLSKPNSWQTRVDYWQDAASWMARYGRHIAFKARGSTGPIRQLIPKKPSEYEILQDENTYDVTFRRGTQEWPISRMHYVRGPARDGLRGDSPVNDVSLAIALEIAAEKFGASFFQNGALPLLVFTFMAGSQGFKNLDEQKQFIEDVQNMFGGGNAHRAMAVPKGMDKPTPLQVNNEQSQFLETRKYQRTVIAGAWNVPPHKVGDLERATFNNVEQQDEDFTASVIMPIGQQFEAAMERDLLTDDDRASGVIIRFNFDSILRADFKSRQEGLQMQRQNGVISPNEWREREGMNPIDEADGGDEYIRPANMTVAGEPPPVKPDPAAAVAASVRSAVRLIQGQNS
jgi:HK97 family phage portal protein